MEEQAQEEARACWRAAVLAQLRAAYRRHAEEAAAGFADESRALWAELEELDR